MKGALGLRALKKLERIRQRLFEVDGMKCKRKIEVGKGLPL